MRTQFCALRRDEFFVRVPMQKSLPYSRPLTRYNWEFRPWRISFGLPLTSELDALCTKDANPILHLAQRWLLCAGANAKGLPYSRPCVGTRNGNRTHNYPLGGGYYIHLTMQAYSVLQFQNREVCLFIIAFFCAKNKSFWHQLFIF